MVYPYTRHDTYMEPARMPAEKQNQSRRHTVVSPGFTQFQCHRSSHVCSSPVNKADDISPVFRNALSSGRYLHMLDCAAASREMTHIQLCTACSLQTCLGKYTYSPEKCDDQLRKLYLCCQSMYDDRGESVESTACPMPSVVRRWLKKHHPSNS